jgi:CTP synthase
MASSPRHRYIFVTGGVMSGVGKGIATASIAKIIQSKGFRVSAIKIDPYLNVDAGTMNPTEHGEVFVLDSGLETDQDMGIFDTLSDFVKLTKNFLSINSAIIFLKFRLHFTSLIKNA